MKIVTGVMLAAVLGQPPVMALSFGSLCYSDKELVCDGEPDYQGVRMCQYRQGNDWMKVYRKKLEVFGVYPAPDRSVSPIGVAHVCFKGE